MSAKRVPIVIALVAVVALAAFWTQVLGPKRKEAADLQAQVSTAETTLAGTRSQVASLRTAKESFVTDYASVTRLGKAVPTDDDMSSLMVQIDAAAKRSGVDFRTIQLSGGGGTTTPAPATAGATPAQATTATLPPGASVGTAGFPTMPFSFEFDGKFFTLSDFFARLHRLVRVHGTGVDVTGRLLTVDAFTLAPGPAGFPSVSATVGATAYLLPGANGAAIGTTPVATTAGATGAAAPASASATPAGAKPATPPVTATSTGVVR